jgi:hypothetical protein
MRICSSSGQHTKSLSPARASRSIPIDLAERREGAGPFSITTIPNKARRTK